MHHNTFIDLCLFYSILLSSTHFSKALECYVCDNQEDNKGKCLTTIQTCNYGEEVCLSEIRWGSTPYWQQGALKQYFVSKRCATKDKCEKFRSNNMATCTHIWYEDWKCSECCKGDRCNYYIISDATAIGKSVLSLVVGLIIGRVF
ncbi:unnamed protein product [Ceutorhynchus assimilis]|uniref:Uncharacterized protein n=1 Tax=Ceutorhynchus assimilis TaxID=467358 RepID=A0A9N9QE40_9CUCU|nr:unnamed protein product [Ceutorhynchus assimilis]